MFERHKQRAALLFTVTDAFLTFVAFETAYQTRIILPMREFFITQETKTLLLGILLLGIVVSGLGLGVYSKLSIQSTLGAVFSTCKQILTTLVGLLAFLYLLNLDVPISRMFIALFFVYMTGFQLLQRILARKMTGIMRRIFGVITTFVVVGDGDPAIRICNELQAEKHLGIRLLALVDCGNPLQTPTTDSSSFNRKPLQALPKLLAERAIDEVIFVVSTEQLQKLENSFLLCDEHGVKTRVSTDFFPHVHSHIHFEHFGDRPLLTFSITPSSEPHLILKRILDMVFAALALLLLALPMLLVGLLVKLSSKGPVIFKQQRCGLNGRTFNFYKLRSMVDNAELLRTGLEHLNEKDGPAFKIGNDPRLTAIGRLLRRFSIDEWPQFWNVLKGEMSFVGPRPALPAEVDHYEIWQRRRLRMRPGLTCLWALHGRDSLDFERWMQLDLEYIDNWSLLLDLKILLLSVPLVLSGKGAS